MVEVGILGATGMVGQRFVQLLENHPQFELRQVFASERSRGRKLEELWRLGEFPEYARGMEVEGVSESNVEVIFSALPGKISREMEGSLLERGVFVFSNSSGFRMEPDVPLVIPEVNPEHLALLGKQLYNGKIVTNPNCSAIMFAIALKPLQQFGIERVFVTTLQAISGAGFGGVPGIDGNVIPNIGGEEEKLETETLKILGELDGNSIRNADFQISAQCNRVPVQDGHTECLTVFLDGNPEVSEVAGAMNSFRGAPQELGLHSAPERVIRVLEDEFSPQPAQDLDGMSVAVGRIRKGVGYNMVILGHNTIRGAAGASILNAELALERGFI